MSPGQDDPESDKIVACLHARKNRIVATWQKRVLTDPELPLAHKLGEPYLTDPIAAFIAAIALEPGGGRQTFRDYAASRLLVGYSAPQTLRELSHLRHAIVDETANTLGENEMSRIHTAIDGIMGEVADEMTALKLDTLREVESRYTLLMENIRDHVILTMDGEGRIVNWNLGAEKITGYSSDEAVGKNFVILFTPEDQAAGIPKQELRQARRDGRAEDRRWHVRKDGSLFWGNGSTTALYDEQGNFHGFIKIARDDTMRKLTEEELAKAKAAAEEANQSKSNFLASMSHEIRTPLGAILGFSELLQIPDLSRDKREQFVASITRNGRELARLIDDILDLSKVEAGHVETENLPVCVAALLDDVLTSFMPKAREKGLQLTAHCDHDVPETIFSDPTRLRQILVNLVGNALKFTDKGHVRISAKVRRFNDRAPDLAFIVEDTGIGVSPEAQARLFRPFTQAAPTIVRKYGGTGLGLVLARELARRLGGDVLLATSHPGQGSTFVMTVRMEAIGAEKAHRLADPEDQGREAARELAGVKVLVAEDSLDNQQIARIVLQAAGATVDIVNNGAEAVEKALTSHPDIVLMDIAMPIMDGYNATKELRRRGFKKPIIALTAHAMQGEREKSFKAGCSEFVTKPFDQLKLVDIISDMVEHASH